MLTKRQARKYVREGWGHCPYCGSDEVEGDSLDAEGNHVYQVCTCCKCEAAWTDEYTLTGVMDGPR
jgi:transcription elongation factor Elf1